MMKKSRVCSSWSFASVILAGGLAILPCSTTARGQASDDFDSGSTGVDGAFAPVESIEVDLSLAGTGPGTGVYDVGAGVIVFNYTTITVPPDVEVRFLNHPHNPPVVWLASGDVVIDGAVVLGGVNGHAVSEGRAHRPAPPGGFPGGLGQRPALGLPATPGLGPGGGSVGQGASHATGATAPTYGNELIQPLIGGSGGGGGSFSDDPGGGGGSGGGAILIASSTTITLGPGTARGTINAVGAGSRPTGSGGAIRLVADDIMGDGLIVAHGGLGGGQGRIRIETAARPSLSQFLVDVIPAPSFGRPGPLFPTAAFPTLRATMVADQPVPDPPAGNILLVDPDVVIDDENPVTIAIEATNMPPGTIVRVRIASDSVDEIVVDSTPLTGTPQFSMAVAQVAFPRGLSHVTLNAEFELGPIASGVLPAELENRRYASSDGSSPLAGPSTRLTWLDRLTDWAQPLVARVLRPSASQIVRGTLKVDGQAIRRVQVTSNGSPAGTRTVYVTESGERIARGPAIVNRPRQRRANPKPAASDSAPAPGPQPASADIAVSRAGSRNSVRFLNNWAMRIASAVRRTTTWLERLSRWFPRVSRPSREASKDAPDQARAGLPSSTGIAPVRPRLSAAALADLDPAYTYDKVGNRLTMADPTGVTAYEYDVMDRLIRMVNPAGQEITFEYDLLGRRTAMVYPNGVVTTYEYDAAGRVTRITATGPAGVVTDFQYTYDAVGNRTAITTPAGVNTYAYDATYQLIVATHPEPANPAESYTYDALGNRVDSHLSSFHVHDDANRLLEDEDNVYTYDAEGNQTSRTAKDAGGNPTGQRLACTWNAENQLVAAERFAAAPDPTPAMTVEYIYDGLGRRLAKIVDGIVTEFVYDFEDILLEIRGLSAARRIVARYTHGPRIDEPLIMQRDSNGDGTFDATFFYHADALGTVHAITDETGNIAQEYTYNAFGEVVDETGIVANFYTYTARERDDETGLYYYRARYYDPVAGRFVSEDTVGFMGGPNLYRYASNNPANRIDSAGTDDGCGAFCRAVIFCKSVIRSLIPGPFPDALVDIGPGMTMARILLILKRRYVEALNNGDIEEAQRLAELITECANGNCRGATGGSSSQNQPTPIPSAQCETCPK